MKQLQSFADLKRFCESQEGLERWTYPRLAVGHVWWIPDIEVGLSGDKHPWVIVRGYSPTRGFIVACSRTTTANERPPEPGIITPANILPGLDKPGLILMSKHRRRNLNPDLFQNYEYIGQLPDKYVLGIREFYN